MARYRLLTAAAGAVLKKKFSPADLTPLLFWGKADGVNYQDVARTTPATAAGHLIRSCSDYGANGNHATSSGAAGTVPTLDAEGKIDFVSGSNQLLTLPAGVAISTQAVTFFMVSKAHSIATQSIYLQAGAGTALLYQQNTSNQVVYSEPGFLTRTGNALNGNWLYHGFSSSDSAVKFFLSGTTVSDAAIGQANTTGGTIGYLAGFAWDGQLAEILLYGRVLSALEVSRVMSYLARWGL